MSKYLTFPEVQFRNAKLLVEALKACGYKEVEVHDVPQSLYGYRGDVRPEQAEIIVRRQHVGTASNDLGFVKNASGAYTPIVSEFDSAANVRMPKVKAAYNERVAHSVAHQLRGAATVQQVGKTKKVVVRF